MKAVIRAIGIGKTFGATRLLADLNLDVARNECVGISGVNGSGRSTLMRILGTVLQPSSGVVEIDGADCRRDVHAARRRIAYAGDEPLPGNGLTSLEYLELIQSVRGVERRSHGGAAAPAVLARAGVPENAFIHLLSRGIRQRLQIAAALSSNADVLILDDPFRGMDVDGRTGFLRWVSERRDAGSTVVITSNDQSDLSLLCQRVMRLENGRLFEQARTALRAAVAVI